MEIRITAYLIVVLLKLDELILARRVREGREHSVRLGVARVRMGRSGWRILGRLLVEMVRH